ncbi:MAG: hypothetical protein AAFX87_18815 [Bacteroidota bacterium]
MKTRISLLTLTLLCSVCCIQPLLAQSGPKYASKETKEIIEKMIVAHGGYEKWAKAPSVRYEHEFENTFAPQQPHWISYETIEPRSRYVYSEWPWPEKPTASMAFDGEKTWTKDWSLPNGAKFMQHISFYFLFLPWLTQDDGVVLGEPGKGKLPHDDKEYITVRMSFKPGTGDTPDDYYILYIDPETYVLKGNQYIVTWGPLMDAFKMPADVKFIGPFYKVYDEYTKVEGLTVPTRYGTYLANDGRKYGDHWARDFSFSEPFDMDKLKMPENAVIDNSTAARKKPNN